ncbi:MAG TPA: ABC transporter permease subunit [Bryobacteraceae bacterium]|jgi:NitT/TauT family transport system permease protein
MGFPLLARSLIRERNWSLLVDALVFAAILAGIYAVLATVRYWMGVVTPAAHILRSPAALPAYAFYSLMRMAAAYLLSLVFAVAYGYIAAYNRRVEMVMIAVLDILQSIPVLSFLPGVMLAMVALFPTRQLGVELGSIVLIFTGQVWNMAFSFYSSLKSIPRELREAALINRFSATQRFVELELPFGTIGLVWNSIVSVAGGWFFLMACEMFELGHHDFRLPGLGSYLQTAASTGDTAGIVWGLGAMIAVIVLLDQLVWRPAIAWSEKFKMEQVESASEVTSPILHLLRNSEVSRWVEKRAVEPLWERLTTSPPRETPPIARTRSRGRIAGAVLLLALAVAVPYLLVKAVLLLKGLHSVELLATLQAAGASFGRVAASLVIASLWAIPAGVAIGSNPRLAKVAQPLAQIAASVPATALFPVVLLGLVRLGGGLGVGSIILMLLGTQWYILFNVIAGAMAIPTELREAASVFHFTRWQRWRTLILPGIFPYLVTGLVTASGGAWNASIVAEYFHFQGKIMTTLGLGAQISSATDSGNSELLLLSTVVMATLVVCVNRAVWRPLYRLAESRFRLES